MASTIGVSNAGTVFFSGTASNINTQALITNAVNAKLLVKKKYVDQVTTNTSKITAFQALGTQATTLKTALDNLSSTTIGTAANPFSSTQVNYTTSDGSTPANILNATTTTGAQAGTYNIKVSQLATAQTVSSAVQLSASTALGYTGTFDIGEAGKTAATINVTGTTTLSDIRDQINASTLTSGVKADILQQANGQYKLIISGNDTAKAVSVSNVTGTDVLTSLGATNSSHAFTNVVQAAQQAQITLNGIAVNSDSNTISNVLSGFTLNLTNAAPTTTVTVTVGNNTTGTGAAIKAFVDAYNTLQNTIAANKKVSADGTVDANAALYGETTNSGLGTSLSSVAIKNYGSGIFNGLRALGITLDANSNLVIDTTQVNDALTNHFGDVQSLFASKGGTTGLADALSAHLSSYTNQSTGLIQSQINALQASDVKLNTKADEIQSAADQYQLRLINTYAKLETTIQSATLIKQQITAILTGSSKQN